MATGTPCGHRDDRPLAFAARLACFWVACAGCAPIDTPGPDHLDAAFDAQPTPEAGTSEGGADGGTFTPSDAAAACSDGSFSNACAPDALDASP
jgi:hypothetical protein